MTSFRGRLADVGKVGVLVYPGLRGNASERLCLDLPIMEVVESCGEKCASICRVYKLIMISRVPGYGQLEYLEVNYWLISSLYLMKLLGY